MAITKFDLGSIGINTDATVYTAAAGVPSITPTTGRLLCYWIGSTRSGATPSQPTMTGNGVTWVAVASIVGNTAASPVSRLTCFRAMGTPSAGAATITFAEQQQNCLISAFELAGINIGGSNGSAAIIQAVTSAPGTAVTEVPLTLAAFASATNGAIYGVLKASSSGVAAESGWFEVHEVGSTSPVLRLQTSWRASQDATIAGSTWSPSAAAHAMAIGIEIGEFVSAPTALPWIYYQRMREVAVR